LNLGPDAEPYGRKLQEKRINAPHHIQKIVALSEIYGQDKGQDQQRQRGQHPA
jgi:hypothetical protein